MAINKVIFGNQTLMDTTGVTVTPNTMTRGTTALAANGETITGALDTAPLYNDLDKTSEGYALDARQGKALNDKITGLGDPVTVAHGGTGASTVGGARTILDVYSKNEIEEKINLYSTVGPTSIASFDDAIDDNAKDLVVSVKPVQDLHGYDNPWPAGGGKNLLPIESETSTIYGVQFTVNSNGTVTASRVSTNSNWANFILAEALVLQAGTYKVHAGVASDDVMVSVRENNASGSILAQTSAYGSVATLVLSSQKTCYVTINFRPTYSGTNIVITPMIELSSTATDFVPYSNICPISGWIGASVSRTGKNLLSGLVQGAINTYGSLNSSIANRVSSAEFIPVKPGETYTISGSTNISGIGTKAYVVEFATAGGTENVSSVSWSVLPKTFIVDHSAKYIKIMVSTTNDSALTPSNIQDAQIEVGSTSTAYESYTGTTIPISWQSKAGTVYGGTLNVTTGMLTVDRAMMDLGTLNWISSTTPHCFYANMSESNEYALGNVSMLCSAYRFDGVKRTAPYYSDNGTFCCYLRQTNLQPQEVYFHSDAISDAASFKQSVTGQTLVFPLATPQTYQLTPTQVALLLGQNNVWADCGDTTITYRRNDFAGINREILNLQEDAAKSVIYTNQQSLTNTQKEIVRSNIGAASQTDVETAQTTANNAVKYNAAQTLTTAQKAQARANIGAEAAGVVSSARPLIYCWGDSLTEGVGGYVMMPDGANAYMAYSYPAWLGQTWDVVNMGARSEDCHAIMARQGADPIVIQTGFTIPASKDTPVEICSITQIYNTTTGTGFTSRSEALVKINKEVESPGLNPCTINDVEGIIYREMTSSALNNETTYKYYFKRLEDGAAMNVAAGTEIKTYAMNHCRNGVAIIWMGMNGGYTSVSDYLTKIRTMVTYGQYSNYLVIISREFSGSDLETIKTELTDDSGFCHVVDLMAQLPYRGYAMAGIPFLHVDTSGWSTTDPVKKHAPLLCEYLSGQTGENQYGTLHYSAWGYKAIAKLVNEKLLTMNLTTGGANETPTGDSYGTYLYKLAAPRSLSGTNYLNTHVKLFDDVSKNWTMAIKWSGTVSCPDGYPANVFCCAKDGAWKGVLYRYYAAQGANLLFGSGAMNVDGANNATDNWGGTNVVIIAKSGDAYNVYCNSTNKVYGTTLTYALSANDAIDLPLIIGARYNAEGTEVQYKTAMMLGDLRIYDAALDDTDCQALYAELAGA